MGNSFGSYSEPGTRHNYQAEASPLVQDNDSRLKSDGGGVKVWEVAGEISVDAINAKL